MRWKDNLPEIGDIRTRSGYLFFPLKIRKETRWLEFAVWKEEYSCSARWLAYEWIESND